MPAIQIIITGATETSADLEQIIERLQNLEEPLVSAGQAWSNYMLMNFDTSGQGSWPALSAATLRRKKGLGSILVRDGDMKQAATAGEWQGSPFVATLGVPYYSEYHFDGTSFMPARDYSEFQEDLIVEIEKIFEAYLFAGIG